MAKCMGCKKNLLRCKCNLSIKGGKPMRRVPGGEHTRNFTRNGTTWCGACGCRVQSGRCDNGACKTRSA